MGGSASPLTEKLSNRKIKIFCGKKKEKVDILVFFNKIRSHIFLKIRNMEN
jgi:hypothetical protein